MLWGENPPKHNSAFICETVCLSSLYEGEETGEMCKGLSPNQFIILSSYHYADCPTHYYIPVDYLAL